MPQSIEHVVPVSPLPQVPSPQQLLLTVSEQYVVAELALELEGFVFPLARLVTAKMPTKDNTVVGSKAFKNVRLSLELGLTGFSNVALLCVHLELGICATIDRRSPG